MMGVDMYFHDREMLADEVKDLKLRLKEVENSAKTHLKDHEPCNCKYCDWARYLITVAEGPS